MRRSLAHWTSMQSAWHGYSYATSSSMYSVMGEPEKALDQLTFFTDGNTVADCQMTPNTMYREGKNLALESPWRRSSRCWTWRCRATAGC